MGAAEAAAAARQSAVNDAREAVASLTARQREVALLLVQGLGCPEIAERLNVSRNTAIEHSQQINKRLNAESAWQTGWLLSLGGLK